MATVETLQIGIESLEHSIAEKQSEILEWKKSMIRDLQSDVLDEYTINTLESKVKKIQKAMAYIDCCESKIRLVKQIINING